MTRQYTDKEFAKIISYLWSAEENVDLFPLLRHRKIKNLITSTVTIVAFTPNYRDRKSLNNIKAKFGKEFVHIRV